MILIRYELLTLPENGKRGEFFLQSNKKIGNCSEQAESLADEAVRT